MCWLEPLGGGFPRYSLCVRNEHSIFHTWVWAKKMSKALCMWLSRAPIKRILVQFYCSECRLRVLRQQDVLNTARINVCSFIQCQFNLFSMLIVWFVISCASLFTITQFWVDIFSPTLSHMLVRKSHPMKLKLKKLKMNRRHQFHFYSGYTSLHLTPTDLVS